MQRLLTGEKKRALEKKKSIKRERGDHLSRRLRRRHCSEGEAGKEATGVENGAGKGKGKGGCPERGVRA